MKICYTCFKSYDVETNICPFCGNIVTNEPAEPVHLTPGTRIGSKGRYIIGTSIGQGGFGIVYRAWDTKLEVLIAVKEFYNSTLMTRIPGTTDVIPDKKVEDSFIEKKNRYLAEARIMAKLSNNPDFVNVFDFFEENKTAYIVMELLNGKSLSEYFKDNNGNIDQNFAVYIIQQTGKALKALHNLGIIHRDVAPDNIYICNNKDIKIKLLDLGAAKLADDSDSGLDIVLKPGFSSLEQYNDFNGVSPASDVYSLGATLYYILTRIKPDEATNRDAAVDAGEKDTLEDPRKFNPVLTETQSNTILKAMALREEYRFHDVDSFLKALIGKKKVLTVASEKMKRKNKRRISILVAIIILGIVTSLVWKYYRNKRKIEFLEDAKLEIWYSIPDGSEKTKAMEAIKEDFSENFPNIDIVYRAIPESDYATEIESAAKQGTLPNMFESTGLSEEILINTIDLSGILDSDQAKECLFLNQYENYYINHNRIPLAIEVPVACVITSGYTKLDYSGVYFNSLDDFKTESIAVDERHLKLIEKNFLLKEFVTADYFLDNSRNQVAVMLTSTTAFNEIRRTLTNYLKNYVYPNTDRVECNFDYEWSIEKGNSEEEEAAVRLLTWMLGNNYQNTLMISRNNDGQIPINTDCFMAKMQQKNYEPIMSIYEKFVFEK